MRIEGERRKLRRRISRAAVLRVRDGWSAELETLLSFTGPQSRAGCEAVAFEEVVAMAEEAVEEEELEDELGGTGVAEHYNEEMVAEEEAGMQAALKEAGASESVDLAPSVPMDVLESSVAGSRAAKAGKLVSGDDGASFDSDRWWYARAYSMGKRGKY